MTRDELSGLMARVAIALNRRPGTFSIDSRPLGEGWAVFVDGDYDTSWLEVSARKPTEEDACADAWMRVCMKLRDAATSAELEMTDAEMLAARKRLLWRTLRDALRVEKEQSTASLGATTNEAHGQDE